MKIDKNIPLPPLVRGNGKWQKLMREMQDGDSILLPRNEAKSLVASMYNQGIQPATRLEGFENMMRMIRVWKIGEFK